MTRLHAALIAALLVAGCASNPQVAAPMEQRVAELIDRTVGAQSRQEQAFEELEALGDPAVPYLVGHLGDVRSLKNQAISLSNTGPNAFEGLRHYTPETVHDALVAILNQITGESFVWV